MDNKNFGNGVYGLINFRFFLIRNYVFKIWVYLFLFGKMAQPFSIIQTEQWEGSVAIFSYP